MRVCRDFEIIFEAVNPVDGSGYVAIDDVQFNNCEPTASSCPSDQFKCSNGEKCLLTDEVTHYL